MSDDRAPLNEFAPFGKIPRLRRNCVITEKIDGTNAQVYIERTDDPEFFEQDPTVTSAVQDGNHTLILRAGSRKQNIVPGRDNAGFARWVAENAEELAKLGEGRHYGEWWGQGIQRRYGLDHKRFSLFNSARWADDAGSMLPGGPQCCHVVPVLYSGIFTTEAVDAAVEALRSHGSLAAPGFDRPEGVIVYQLASGTYGKVLLENDEMRKSVVEGLEAAARS